jgi:hypothetical protein
MAFSQQSNSSSEARIPKGKLACKTESKELVKANGDRIELIVTNEGAKDAWLCLGATAVAAVFAITAEGESNLTFAEV